jgi:hypothetical protein
MNDKLTAGTARDEPVRVVVPKPVAHKEGTVVKVDFKVHTGGRGVSVETIEVLEDLLRQAKAGKVVGICYAAMHEKRRFTVHACGEAGRNPTFARGMVASLDDHLGFKVLGIE